MAGRLLGPPNYPKLLVIKKKYDPTGLFLRPMSVCATYSIPNLQYSEPPSSPCRMHGSELNLLSGHTKRPYRSGSDVAITSTPLWTRSIARSDNRS